MNPAIKVSAWQCAGSAQITVVGVGARTSIGSSAPATAAAVRGGISGLSLHPSFVDAGGEPVSFAADPFIDPDVSVEQRMLDMLQPPGTAALSWCLVDPDPTAARARIAGPAGCDHSPPSGAATLTVTVVKVPGEEGTENNKQTYTLLFTQ